MLSKYYIKYIIHLPTSSNVLTFSDLHFELFFHSLKTPSFHPRPPWNFFCIVFDIDKGFQMGTQTTSPTEGHKAQFSLVLLLFLLLLILSPSHMHTHVYVHTHMHPHTCTYMVPLAISKSITGKFQCLIQVGVWADTGGGLGDVLQN